MPDVLTNALVAIVVGGVSAYVAGVFGVRRAVDRLKRERAIERSLDWCEEMVYELSAYGSAFHAALEAQKLGATPERQAPYWTEIQDLATSLARLAPGAGLYAPVEAVRLVEALPEEFVAFGESLEPNAAPEQAPSYKVDRGRVEAHLRGVIATTAVLTSHYRTQGGLEALPPRGENRALSIKAAEELEG